MAKTLAIYVEVVASDAWLPFRLNDDDSYIERYQLPSVGNAVYVVWCPDGRVLVKPGCRPLEPIDRTIKRLEHIAKTDRWMGEEFNPKRTATWLKILRNCAQYEWSAT